MNTLEFRVAVQPVKLRSSNNCLTLDIWRRGIILSRCLSHYIRNLRFQSGMYALSHTTSLYDMMSFAYCTMTQRDSLTRKTCFCRFEWNAFWELHPTLLVGGERVLLKMESHDSECHSNKERHILSSRCLSLCTIGFPMHGNSLVTDAAVLERRAGVYPCLRVSTQIAHRRCSVT